MEFSLTSPPKPTVIPLTNYRGSSHYVGDSPLRATTHHLMHWMGIWLLGNDDKDAAQIVTCRIDEWSAMKQSKGIC
ncbi:hypothetical protein ACMD2_15574 [Ananas comosus]|uniref:Uncharacterized protein n=1 Tax=Ananas comosus TaxID=4615 RepID=A0A199UFU7_ANACO|nr:hypothetical protein ACMD2_15574 [Ananas comosus]